MPHFFRQSPRRLPPPVAPYSDNDLPSEVVVIPLIFPVLGSVDWRNSYNDERAGFKHTGIDIRAPKMRPIVAPFSGYLGMKIYSFWIYGDDDWRCLGTHLNDDTPGTNDGRTDVDFMFAPNLRHGDRVTAGQLLGYVGNSGDATGPHLHFEIHGPDGIRSPYASLKAAQKIREPRLILPGVAARPDAGLTRLEACPREYNGVTQTLRVILAAKQLPNGSLFIAGSPTFYRLSLTPDALADLGGPDGIRSMPRDRAITFYVREGAGGRSGVVRRLIARDRDLSSPIRFWNGV